MGTQSVSPQIDPRTGERVAIDPSTGERVGRVPANIDHRRVADAMVYSQLTGAPASVAYGAYDTFKEQVPLSPTLANDIKVGFEGSISGMAYREKLPETLKDPSLVDDLISGVAGLVGDLPAIVAGFIGGGISGSEIPVVGTAGGAAIGSFAVPRALRRALVLQIERGDPRSFGELLGEMADVLKEGSKGAVEGAVFEVAGAATLPMKFLGPAGRIAAEKAMAGLQQAAAVTVAGSLLDGQMPTVKDFERNAAMVGVLGLATHGVSRILPNTKALNTKQALLDVYAKDGTTPAEAVEHLKAQPPDKAEQPRGLQPAIKLTAKDGTKQVISGEDATHADLSERVTGIRPVTIEELENDPGYWANKVLDQPEIHTQDVIDRAYELQAELGEPVAGGLKSGRGFTTDGVNWMNRAQSRKWLKKNEPENYEMWKLVVGGEKDASGKPRELHSADYNEAVDRMNGRNLVEGEINYSGTTPQNIRRTIAARKGLNEARASLTGKSKRDKPYEEELRTFITGQKDERTAIANNLRRTMREKLPDPVDRQALTLMRDYKGNEQGLRERLALIQSGDLEALGQAFVDLKLDKGITDELELLKSVKDFEGNKEAIMERLKNIEAVIQRALEPTDAMKTADAEITKYAAATLEEGRYVGALDSSIPADKYITHILLRSDTDADAKGVSRPRLATNTPYGKQRTYPTTLDAMIAGKIPRTLDALDAIAVYGDRHATMMATRLFATELKNTKLGMIGTQKNIPADWQRLGEGRLFEYTGVDKDGKPFTTALYAPKKLVDAMAPITDRMTLFRGPKGEAFQRFREVQTRLKAAWVGLAVFHGNALTHSAINNMGIDILKLAHEKINSPEFMNNTAEWAADGLITARSRTPYEVYKGMEGVSAFGEVPSRMDVVRNIYGMDKLNKLAEKTTYATFDILQTLFKVPDATIQEAAWLKSHPNATKAEHFAARRSIAKEVNAVYGGLNWEALGWTPNQVELLRAFMLAPDWSFSNVYNLKYAMPKFLGGEGGAGSKAARMFWFRSTVNGLAFTQAMSLFITGEFSSNATQVYLGRDKNGKEMYSSWFFAGAPKDLVTQINAWKRDGAITGTAEFLSYKLGPLVGTVPRLLVDKDWSGKPIIKKSQGFAEKTGREALFVGGEILPAPFAVKTAAQMITDPDKDYTYTDFLSGLAGAPVYHRDPEGTKRSSGGSGSSRKGFSISRKP